MLMICAVQTSVEAKSYATDINNYGVYDSERIKDDYFPEKLKEGITLYIIPTITTIAGIGAMSYI